LQIDFDAHAFARTGPWRDPAANIDYGTSVLSGARDSLARRVHLADGVLLRASIVAYNSGVGNVLRALQGRHDLDFYTAGRNYSSDVLSRAGWFAGKGWACQGRGGFDARRCA